MSESVNQALSNDEDLDMEFLQFDEENYAYQDFNSNDGDLQGNVGAETGALSLGQLQQEVIDEHENFLQNLTRMVELERERVDEVYRGHEPAVNLNQQLHKEIATMKERVDQAFEFLAKMQALLGDS